jgi:hypothetical protein
MKTTFYVLGILVVRAALVKAGLEILPWDVIQPLLQQIIGEVDVGQMINTTLAGYLAGSTLHRQPKYAAKAVVNQHLPNAVATIRNLWRRN